MFRSKISQLAITFCIGLAFVLAGATVLQAKPITLSYSIFFPPTHAQAKAAKEYAKEVEKRTDGKVKINCYCGGTLTKAPQVYDGVVKGISDMGNSCFAYTRGRFPVMEAVDLPMGYKNGMQASQVANAFAKKINPKELQDVKCLYVHAHGPGLLHTRKAPVESVEDVKGMKIRATGLSAKVVKALGGTPVAMPQGDTYQSLQKGVVDGTFGPMEVLKGWKQGEVIDYTTNCYSGSYTTAMFVVMNKDKWNSLPKDVQKVFDNLAKEYVRVHGNAWISADQSGKEFTLDQGNTILTLSDAELKEWKEAVQPVIQEYIDETENGQEYVNTVRDLVKKYKPEQ
ncbi:MAG TPA: TRAP transporter substrate-binding protein [Desulfohalobiaceae bacterium]|nr:TRAP transporter substrate-binding protein [Desulfohalobiaceae bacterium]